MLLLAWSVAVLHALAVVLMLTGALLALRWPRLLLVHAPVALTILAVGLAGADCPLTDVELALRQAAGAPGYDGGFLSHYLFEPLGLDVDAAATQLGIHAAAFGLNALGYGLVVGRRRAAAARSSNPDTPSAHIARARRPC